MVTKFIFMVLWSGHLTVSAPMNEASCTQMRARAIEQLHRFYPATPMSLIEMSVWCQPVTGVSEQ